MAEYTERLVSSKKHDRIVRKAIELKAENTILRDALEKFANESNWLRDEEYRIYEWQGVEDVPFNIAKEALRSKP